jgi:hypothetical protein
MTDNVGSTYKCHGPGMVVHICNHSTQEAEAGGLKVQGQTGLPSETLFQKIIIFLYQKDRIRKYNVKHYINTQTNPVYNSNKNYKLFRNKFHKIIR